MEVAATSWPRSSTDACYLHSSKARSSASRSAPSETAPLVSGHQAASDANSAKTSSCVYKEQQSSPPGVLSSHGTSAEISSLSCSKRPACRRAIFLVGARISMCGASFRAVCRAARASMIRCSRSACLMPSGWKIWWRAAIATWNSSGPISRGGRETMRRSGERTWYNVYAIAPASRHLKGQGLTLDEARQLQRACEHWLCVRRAPFVHYLTLAQRAREREDEQMRAFQRSAARRPCDPDGPFIDEWWADLVVGKPYNMPY